MTRFALAVAAVFAAAVLTGCGGDEESAVENGAAAVSAEPTTAASAPNAGVPEPTASAEPAKDGPSAGLTSALSDVRKIAPRLESYYRGGDYPRELDKVIASLSKAGSTLSPGNSLGAYSYDEDAVEFVLCVENTSGAFATYDTAPMVLGEQGESGGCPRL